MSCSGGETTAAAAAASILRVLAKTARYTVLGVVEKLLAFHISVAYFVVCAFVKVKHKATKKKSQMHTNPKYLVCE